MNIQEDAEVERLTAELAVEKAEHAETTRELNNRYVELADDGARLAAAEAREEALKSFINNKCLPIIDELTTDLYGRENAVARKDDLFRKDWNDLDKR